jgi:hypothetical protein
MSGMRGKRVREATGRISIATAGIYTVKLKVAEFAPGEEKAISIARVAIRAV